MFSKHINIEDKEGAIVEAPQRNTLYRIKKSAASHEVVEVSFSGNDVDNYMSVNVVSGFFVTKSTMSGTHLRGCIGFNESFYLIPKMALPVSIANTKLPLVLFALKNSATVVDIDKIEFILNENETSIQFSGFKLKTNTIKFYSQTLQKECQAMSGKIPVIAGEYPLFFEEKRPDSQYLSNLFTNFLRYNSTRLADQLKQTDGVCHIRAHFVSVMMSYYGIDTIKLYKFYKASDWDAFSSKRWSFHCAAMVIDKNNNKWVFDPWIYPGSHLLTLQQWLNAEDEPAPVKLVLANKVIVDDLGSDNLARAKHPMGEDLLRLGSSGNLRFLQAMFASAIPNRPEFPIADPQRMSSRFFGHARSGNAPLESAGDVYCSSQNNNDRDPAIASRR